MLERRLSEEESEFELLSAGGLLKTSLTDLERQFIEVKIDISQGRISADYLPLNQNAVPRHGFRFRANAISIPICGNRQRCICLQRC